MSGSLALIAVRINRHKQKERKKKNEKANNINDVITIVSFMQSLGTIKGYEGRI